MKFKSKIKENKKNEILEATYTCIYEQGIAEVSLRAIAEKIKSNQSLVHYYFKNKENLLIELITNVFDKILTDVQTILKSPNPPEKKLDLIVDAAMDFIKRRKKLFVVFIDCWSLAIRNKTMRKKFSKLYDENRKLFENILEEGKKTGVFSDFRTDIIAVSIMSYVAGLALQRHMVNSPMDLETHFNAWARTLKKIILKGENKGR